MALGMGFVVNTALRTGIGQNLGWEMGFGPALQDPLSTLLILAVCRTNVTRNLVDMISLVTSLPVAQWLESRAHVWVVMGSIPIRDSDFFFVPGS